MQGNLPVSFGKGVTEKGWFFQYLAGALLHSREGPTEKGESTSLAAYSTLAGLGPGHEPRVCEDSSRQLGGGEATNRSGAATGNPPALDSVGTRTLPARNGAL